MTDDELDELLSRHLDGDLDRAETAKVAQLVAGEEWVAARLTSLAGVRRAVAGLAAREEAPACLDLVMEPLRRERRGPRPRWRSVLAVAAAVVVALAVGWQVVRRPATDTGGAVALRGTAQPTARATAARHDAPSELHAAARRGRLPEIPAGDAPPPLDVIGPLPFPPDVYGGHVAVLALSEDVTIPLRVPASCPAGVHRVLAMSSAGEPSELTLRAVAAHGLAGCTPLVVLDPVPAGMAPTPARLIVAS